jgi:hypothetical protein
MEIRIRIDINKMPIHNTDHKKVHRFVGNGNFSCFWHLILNSVYCFFLSLIFTKYLALNMYGIHSDILCIAITGNKNIMLLRHRSGAGIGVNSTALSTGLTRIYNWRISSSPRNCPIFLPHPLVDLLTIYYGDY